MNTSTCISTTNSNQSWVSFPCDPSKNVASVQPSDRIPAELKSLPQWIGFTLVWNERREKFDKIPFNVHTGGKASVSDPQTWTDYNNAVRAHQQNRCDGIGFVFATDDPYCGIDLDACRDAETGQVESWARDIINRLHSYTEVSPSGTGVHIITKATLPPGGRKKDLIEMYDQGRFFTVSEFCRTDYMGMGHKHAAACPYHYPHSCYWLYFLDIKSNRQLESRERERCILSFFDSTREERT